MTPGGEAHQGRLGSYNAPSALAHSSFCNLACGMPSFLHGPRGDFEGPKDELIDDKVAPGPRDMCARDKNKEKKVEDRERQK